MDRSSETWIERSPHGKKLNKTLKFWLTLITALCGRIGGTDTEQIRNGYRTDTEREQ